MKVVTIILAILLPGLALADTGTRLVDFGVICAVQHTGVRTAPLTESGTVNLINDNRKIDVTTSVVPAQIGLSFGIQAETSQRFENGIRVVVTHAPMGPRGVTMESWTTPLDRGRPMLSLFSFEHGYELVEGPWVFQLVLNGEVLAEQAFLVVPPEAAPKVMRACFPDPALS